jgi:predicted TIM-barrel fold metal-dependent hydrolase
MVRDVAMDIAKNQHEYRFRFPWELKDENPDYHQYCQRDVYSILHPGEDLTRELSGFTGFDFIITFSANLTTRLPRDYRTANSKIREALIEKSQDNAPHNNFRFIGFGRVDPNHSDAQDAFDNVYQLGLKGLKLHPKEENFEITDKKTVELLIKAAHYSLPVIFHTQEGQAAQVEEAVNMTITELINGKRTNLLPRLKVICGHAPWNGIGNEDLYRILSHPNIFGELSTLRAESFMEFFSSAKEHIRYERIFDVPALEKVRKSLLEGMYFRAFGYNSVNYWGAKLMFGSDTPYPPSHDAAPLIKHMFSRDFVGGSSDIQNILGANALRLVPPPAAASPAQGVKKASSNPKFHAKQLEGLMAKSKALSVTPLIENFPVARVGSAVFNFLSHGKIDSYMFKCLFDSKKPLCMVLPNPFDMSGSSKDRPDLGIARRIESCLGGD